LTSAFKCSQGAGEIKGMKNEEGGPNTCWKNHKEIYKNENLISSRHAARKNEGERTQLGVYEVRNQTLGLVGIYKDS